MLKLVNFQNIKFCNNESITIEDLEDIVSVNNIQIKKNSLIPDNHREKITNFMLDLIKYDLKSEKEYHAVFITLRRKHGIHPKKSQIYYIYRIYKYKKFISKNEFLEDILITKKMRSQSGVLVISVIMPPDNFSCTYNCHYCPNDPTYSRSYYKGEPTVQRGERNGFNAHKQFYDRALAYFVNGHSIDKVEIIILGGTFSCYDPTLSKNFICDLFWAANTIFDDKSTIRKILSLDEEIKINENALCKIIGITIETRPDKITKYELRRFRSLGITRIQIGVQHTDDDILNNLNRECNQKEIKAGIKLAKDNGFKIDIHLMPDLPLSSIKKDYAMFETIINDEGYQADQWKIYPTNILEFTKIKEWYDNGTYKPYAETHFTEFVELLLWVMTKIPPWIRVNRVQRDFPGNYIEGGNKVTNLRQVLDDEMIKNKYITNDIRSMEVKHDIKNMHKARLVRCDYKASGGLEIFLSHKSCSCKFCWKHMFFRIKYYIMNIFGIKSYFYGCGYENTIYSFIRLRITQNDYNNVFSLIYQNTGKIRELHVYGQKIATNEKSEKTNAQHSGFGKVLLSTAEDIAKSYKCNGTLVIAGVGTRNYYRKFGYEIPYSYKDHGWFMLKKFNIR